MFNYKGNPQVIGRHCSPTLTDPINVNNHQTISCLHTVTCHVNTVFIYCTSSYSWAHEIECLKQLYPDSPWFIVSQSANFRTTTNYGDLRNGCLLRPLSTVIGMIIINHITELAVLHRFMQELTRFEDQASFDRVHVTQSSNHWNQSSTNQIIDESNEIDESNSSESAWHRTPVVSLIRRCWSSIDVRRRFNQSNKSFSALKHRLHVTGRHPKGFLDHWIIGGSLRNEPCDLSLPKTLVDHCLLTMSK